MTGCVSREMMIPISMPEIIEITLLKLFEFFVTFLSSRLKLTQTELATIVAIKKF